MVKWLILAAVLAGLGWATWKKPRLTSSIVWSLTATLLLTAITALLLPAAFIKPALLWLSILTPLIWVGFIFWCHWDRRPIRPAAGLIGLTVIGAVIVIQLPPPVAG